MRHSSMTATISGGKDRPIRMSSEEMECSLDTEGPSLQLCMSNDDNVVQDKLQEEVEIGVNILLNMRSSIPKDVRGNGQFIGLRFKSDEEAYNSYNTYARSVGFSIRKQDTTKRPDGTITRRMLCCNKEGQYRKHPRGTPNKQRPITRTGCFARIAYRLVNGEGYVVDQFIEEHNHELEPPSTVHRLRSQKKIQPAHADLIDVVNIANGATLNADSNPSLSARYNELLQIALTIAAKGATTAESSALSMLGLMRLLAEVESHLNSHSDHAKDTSSVVPDDVNKDSVSQRMNSNLTIRDLPNKKRKGQHSGRLKQKKGNKAKHQQRRRITGIDGENSQALVTNSEASSIKQGSIGNCHATSMFHGCPHNMDSGTFYLSELQQIYDHHHHGNNVLDVESTLKNHKPLQLINRAIARQVNRANLPLFHQAERSESELILN